jgi:hypothetical protein
LRLVHEYSQKVVDNVVKCMYNMYIK